MKYLIIILLLFSIELYSDVIVQIKKHINIENNSCVILQMKKLKKVDIEHKFQLYKKETQKNNIIEKKNKVYYNYSDKQIYIDNIENYHQLIISDLLGNVIMDKNISDYQNNDIQVSLNKGVYFIILIDKNNNRCTHKIIN